MTKSLQQCQVIEIVHGSPYEMQTEMSRGPLAEDEHSRKGNVGWIWKLFAQHDPPYLKNEISMGVHGHRLVGNFICFARTQRAIQHHTINKKSRTVETSARGHHAQSL